MSCSQENEVLLPVVDISQISHAFERQQGTGNPALATFRKACEEWGFLYVVNHGIPEDLLQNVESQAAQLRALPLEIKEKLATSNPADAKEKAATSNTGETEENGATSNPSKIIGKTSLSKPKNGYTSTAWMDNFCFTELPHSNSVQEVCDKIWPEEGNPKFCEAIRTYVVSVADLASRISKIIVASLGLDVETVYHADFENFVSHMRINLYVTDRKMSMEEEIPRSHTDIGCFTILYQDKEGGLQVRSKEGKWVDVRPLPNSFVINVADCMKAWSNGRFRSAEHRVVYKGWKDRISIPYFVQFPPDKQITAPEELVDDDHPRRYRPFTFSQFRQAFYNNMVVGKGENPADFIDTYAAI
ncbi:hypothetical protein SUGI_0027050 [Cryptomeria japonica]|uniref:1-aminocyclopropane-1-carboxylate oxidase 5 n=1 Tax=Cryptomeria japonica TaxID=3369 RepID=UPI002408A476|nr:1-aminocyclopropane-1-carboxylate oxidase 5 [Cryptomeria japonica]GLJ05875.1 hypothetical protein SUGI_0027050 [Cryptomeria japonica]